jgi:hypothetical protein
MHHFQRPHRSRCILSIPGKAQPSSSPSQCRPKEEEEEVEDDTSLSACWSFQRIGFIYNGVNQRTGMAQLFLCS